MVWEQCDGLQQITTLEGILFRMVESQEQVATLGYVDTLEEQTLLEEMLEDIKPPYVVGSEEYHYLLKTPFRYPPLKWGSRFGRTHEPSIFYGGCTIQVTLAESAYYRFIFWHSMEGKPVKDKIRTEHTVFTATYASAQGIKLHQQPFDQYVSVLAHPSDYQVSQQLGSIMREANVEVFEYRSARDPLQGVCVGLFTPKAFKEKEPGNLSQWLCEVNAEEVLFKQIGRSGIETFKVENFLSKNTLPFPA